MCGSRRAPELRNVGPLAEPSLEKYDRFVHVYRHRSNGSAVLIPHVCYMAGVSARVGDCVNLPATKTESGETLGTSILNALNVASGADIESLTAERKANLKRYWRNDPTAFPPRRTPPGLARTLRKYPALTKGPATALRMFNLVQVVERDSWRSRRIVVVEKSEHRGCTKNGKSIRVRQDAPVEELGSRVLLLLEGNQT